MTAVATDPTVQAEVVSIPLVLIDRDPKQPRFAENVDTDLAPSFKAHGWFESEPLEIRPHPEDPDRYMLVDGERRYAGAKAAGLKEALCILTLEAEGVSEADRLMRQIMHNSGKPLTPVEQALAFKRIIDDRRNGANGKGDKKYGPVQLSRDLGIPKSTITDRLAMTEIPSFWLKLIVEGPLQPSHVPVLHRYREVPEKYQLRALNKMKDEWNWRSRGGERIYVEDFDSMVREAMRPFIRALSEVPGYKGPVAKVADPRAGWQSRRKITAMAMDPTLWEPIYRKRLAAKRAKTIAAGGAAAKKAKQADKYREQRAREEEARQREQVRRAKIVKARPELLRAFGEKISTVSFGQLRDLAFDVIIDHKRRNSKSAARYVAVGNNADQLLRHLIMLGVESDLAHEYWIEERSKKLGKRLGVDVAAIVKADAKEAKEPDPATADPGEAGDGLLAVGAGPDGDDESDES